MSHLSRSQGVCEREACFRFAAPYTLHRKVKMDQGRPMRELDKALADIIAIRSQIAAGTAFRGYGPATMAATAGVALLTAILQSAFLDNPTASALMFVL